MTVGGLLGPGPPYLAQLAVERSHIDLFSQERTIRLAAAGTGWDPDTARLRCWAEMVERFAASAPQVVRRVVRERVDTGGDMLPWWAFAAYEPGMVDQLDRCAPREHDFVCSARSWADGRRGLVPASRVILHWEDYAGPGSVAGECDATGLAAGCDTEAAALSGLREVLERDAAMQAWRCEGWQGGQLAMSILGEEARHWLDRSSYDARLADIARPGLDPVVVAVLHDEAGATVGTACRGSLATAGDAALLEAAMLRSTIDALGPGDLAAPVRTSLDHVRYGYRHPGLLHDWLDSLKPTAGNPRAAVPLHQRVSAAFGSEPLVVELAGPPEVPFVVVRVLVPGAARKEWRHDLRRDVPAARSVVPSSTRQACPHPFG